MFEVFCRGLGGEVLRDAVDLNCWLSVEFQVLAAGRAQILLSDAPSALDLCVVAIALVSPKHLVLVPTMYEHVPVVLSLEILSGRGLLDQMLPAPPCIPPDMNKLLLFRLEVVERFCGPRAWEHWPWFYV